MTEAFEDVNEGEEFEIKMQLADVGQPNIPLRVTKVRKGPGGVLLIIEEHSHVYCNGFRVFSGSEARVIEKAVALNRQPKEDAKPDFGQGNTVAETTRGNRRTPGRR